MLWWVRIHQDAFRFAPGGVSAISVGMNAEPQDRDAVVGPDSSGRFSSQKRRKEKLSARQWPL